MSEVLYRKYRPQRFADVVGQEVAKMILQNAIRQDRLTHAYLFTGPRGVGKTTIARILAKAVNCLTLQDGEPCTKCENCLEIQAGKFLDLIEIDAASYTGVDNIRDVIDHVRFAPNKGKYKVFIIDEVHMLSKAAFNALLKTLEEPPGHAMFILATTEIQKVPATIISRTQRFDFKTASYAEVMDLLGRILVDFKTNISTEALRLIAQASGGSLRDALSILDQVLSFGSDEVSLEQIEEILGLTRIDAHQRLLDMIADKDQKTAVEFVKKMVFEGRDLVQFAKDFLDYLRLLLLYKIGAEKESEIGLAKEEIARLKNQSEKIPAGRLLAIVKLMMVAHREIKNSPVMELPFLTAVMELTEGEPVKNNSPKEQVQQSTSAKFIDQESSSQQKSVPETDPKKTASSMPDMSAIVARWADVLSQIKEYNHSLISSLRLGRIVAVKDQILVLAFPYSFHKETVDARKNKIVIEQVLEEVYGQKMKIGVCLEKEIQVNEPTPLEQGNDEPDLMNEALRVLGGK